MSDEAPSWHVVGQKIVALQHARSSDGWIVEGKVYTIEAIAYCDCFKWALFGLVELGYNVESVCFSMFPAPLFKPVIEPKVEREETVRGPLDHLYDFARNPPDRPFEAPVRTKELEPA